jgi:hypothetical protein
VWIVAVLHTATGFQLNHLFTRNREPVINYPAYDLLDFWTFAVYFTVSSKRFLNLRHENARAMEGSDTEGFIG